MTQEPATTSPQPGDRQIVWVAARAYERDRFLAALLAPRAIRSDLVTLAAFAGEIARIPSFVAEPLMGEIRLQWWRDVLALPPAERSGHPIADELRAVALRHNLPRSELEDLINVQQERLMGPVLEDDDACAVYLARLERTQFVLAWRVISGAGAEPFPQVLTIAGEAYGLARHLVELPAHLAEGRTLIPRSRLAAAGVDLSDLAAGTAGEGARELMDGLSAATRRRLNDVRQHFRRALWPLRTVLLPVALIEPYLKALEQAGGDPRRVRDIAPLTRVWRLWAAHRMKLV